MTTLPKARKQFTAELGEKVSAKRFRDAITELCDWGRVKRAATELATVLRNCQSVGEAVQAMRPRISCNELILEGLPRKLQVWGKK